MTPSIDVIVIGGGIIGCAVAHALAGIGRRVLVLERRAMIGAEASGAAAGILSPQAEIDLPGPLLELCLRSRALYPAWVRALEAEATQRVDYTRAGSLLISMSAADDEALERRYQWQHDVGLPVERLSGEEMRRLEPALGSAVRWGLWLPQDHAIDSRQLMQALAQAAAARGVVFRTGVVRTRLRIEGQRVSGVEIDAERLSAAWVVDAAGSWAQCDPALPFVVPVEPARGQMLCLDAVPPLLRHVIRGRHGYLVQRADGRLLVGSTLEFVGYDHSVTAGGIQQMLSETLQMVPGLSTLPFREAWAGLRPATPDGLPLLGPTPLESFVLATGHFRNGILLAPITAQLIMEYLTNQPSSVDLTPFLLARYNSLSRR